MIKIKRLSQLTQFVSAFSIRCLLCDFSTFNLDFFFVLFNSLYISDYKNSKFYYIEGYSFYLFFRVLLGSDCLVCPVWSFMSNLVKCVVSDYSGKKCGRGRSVLEIRNEIMSS